MLLNICLVLVALYMISIMLYMIGALISDGYKKHINKILMNIEAEKEYNNMYCDVQYLKEEVEKLKKKRGK